MNFFTSSGVLNVAIVLLLSQLTAVHGLFTKTSCYGSNCVQQDSQGRWCYVPDSRSSSDVTCKGGYSRDASMSAVMAVHLKQGLSIAYYSGVDNALLGGADFPFPPSGGIIRICLSGKAGDGTYQTFCENIHQDNDIYGLTGDPFCIIAVGQDLVSDGCYVPESGVVVAPSSGSTISQTTGSTTTGASTPITKTVSGNLVTATITANGTIQTVVVAGNNNSNSHSTSNYSENVVLPIVLSVLGVVLIAICLGAWLWRKHMRLQRELLLNRPVGPWNQPGADENGKDD
ncbi:hypothetical protein M413DRAFT_288054 [Hebeloma cylindrosporum]|uniref:Uncharacterized protein n=1 Tax=Hebeloma cylindrosporum TaxID=76867 RepID=A0A0C3BYH8_HEBCY|nr:hypothetical protein M413DRAFT_288054 [Hebeloma cylindrosporum h7]